MRFLLFFIFILSSLNANYLVFEDKNNHYNIDLIKENHEKLFTKTTKTSLGATKSTIWLKIDLENPKQIATFKYISFREAFLYEIYLYNGKNILKGGTKVAFENRQFPYVNDTFEIFMTPDSTKEIFIKVIPKYNATYAYNVFDSMEELSKHQNYFEKIFLAYISVMSLIFMGGLIFLIVFKQKLFAYYTYFVFVTILFQFFQTGRILEYIYIPELVKFDEMMAMGVVLGISLFLWDLFKKEIEQNKFIRNIFKTVFILVSVGIFVLLIDFNFYIDLFVELVVFNFSLTAFLIFVIYVSIKKIKYSMFVLAGMFVFTLTSLLTAVYYIGIIDSPYSLVLMQVSSVIEAVAFFSLIMNRVYNQVVDEKQISEKYAKSLHEMQILAKMGTWTDHIKENYYYIDDATKQLLELENNIIFLTELENIIHPEDLENIMDVRKRIIDKHDINQNIFRVITKSGKTKYISTHWQHIFENNELVKVDGYIIDITEKVLAKQELESQEALLMHQQRLAQQGEMLNMIAHQWRQPLTAITATTNNLILRNMIEPNFKGDELNKELTLITEYSQHLSSTINDFRSFFEIDKRKVTNTVEELVEKSLNIINTTLESNEITLIKNYNCEKLVTSFSNEIQQVILNILKNAEDALIHRDIKNRKIFINTRYDEKYAILEISDNAGGIDQNIINRIFEPYFSTKKNQEGTGLGLYMSKTIINEHCDGKLLVSNTDLGALFTIKLKLDN